jgi:hypothetical protein
LYAEWKACLKWKNISLQTYWNGTLVGPDCRRFLAEYRDIFQRLRSKIAEVYIDDPRKATDFYDRHCPILFNLDIITHLTRKVEMLTVEEMDTLEGACSGYPTAFRIAYPGHIILTPKGHTVEKHIMYFIRKYGTLGVFGEDGLEALHPMESRARLIVRTMRNSVQRHKSMQSHLIVQQHFRGK